MGIHMNTQQMETMVQQYEKLVYTVCYQFTRNHHTAQDLAQDTFVSAFTHLDSCPAGNEKAWLARIATNKAKDHLKSAYNRKALLPGEEAVQHSAEEKTDAIATPETQLLEKETQSIIYSEIDGLKEPYRKVATLHLLQDYSILETAELLGRPRKTVQTQVYRAKKILRQRLQGLAPGLAAS